MLINFDKKACLSYDPLCDEPSVTNTYVRFKDKIGIARKTNTCMICFCIILKGDTIRIISDKFDGVVATHRFCNVCCVAMAESWNDEGKSITERYDSGYRKAEELR